MESAVQPYQLERGSSTDSPGDKCILQRDLISEQAGSTGFPISPGTTGREPGLQEAGE